MRRRLALTAVALALLGGACSNCDNPCKGGITFVVGEIAGALSAGSEVPLNICFDADCKDVRVTRNDVGGSIFLEFNNVAKQGDHKITVSSTVSAIHGEYNGPLATFEQDPGGSCSTCDLATVKIAADGTLTPGVPAPSVTTTVAQPVSTSNG
jgi:hypothetical protein